MNEHIRKLKKKTLSMALAAALAGALLSGCGGSSTGGGPSPAPAAGASSYAEDNGSSYDGASAADTSAPGTRQTDGRNVPELTTEPLEILLWDIAAKEPEKTIQEGAVQRFMADYPNITVTQVHQQSDDYKQHLIVAMSAGQCPDMYIHWGGGPMADYYDAGFVNDITDLFNQYDHPDFIDAAVAQAAYKDKILAIPFGGFSGCEFFYNRTIFAECGIEVPQTIDELEAACETLKAGGYTPFALANGSGGTGSMYFMYLVARHSGNDEFNAAYEQTGSFTSEAFIWAADKIQDWVRKGYFNDDVNSLFTEDGQDRQLLYDNTCAMMLHSFQQCQGIKADDKDWYNTNLGVFRFPEDDEAKAKGVPQNVEVGTAMGSGFSFNCFNDDGSVDKTKLDACYVLATQYYNDEAYNRQQAESGVTPCIKGYESKIFDPNLRYAADVFVSASDVQLWYDQYLPPSVTKVHKDCMACLFGLEKTPQEICQLQEDAMKAAMAGQ